MRRRCLLAEQLEPRLVLSVVGAGSRAAGTGFESEAAPSDESSAEPSSSYESTETDAASSAEVSGGEPAPTESTADTGRPRGGSRNADSSAPSPTAETTSTSSGTKTTAEDSEVVQSDDSATTSTGISRLSPSVETADVETDSSVRVIVLRRLADVEETDRGDTVPAGDSIVPHRDLESFAEKLATATVSPQVSVLPATAGLHHAVNQLTDGVTSRTSHSAHHEGDPAVTVARNEGWLSSLASSIGSWFGLGAATNLAHDAAHTAQLPLVALAGMFSFATLGRKGTADASKFAPPTTDERFELTQRRWWRERRRGESHSRSGRGGLRRFGRETTSPIPADNRPTLAQPDISEAFVLSLMDSIEPDAFVMSPMLPAPQSDDNSSEHESGLSPSMKLAFAGTAIGGTAVAGNAWINRRGSRTKRPARPIVRYTGTTVVPQSSVPQPAGS